MHKWIITALAGAAFVAGGFVAGSLGAVDTAAAVTDAAATLVQVDDEGTDGRRGPGHGHHRGFPSDVADELGIDMEAFRTELAGGATVAQAIEAQGISVDAATDALLESATERLAEAVADDKLTQGEADEKLADLEGRIAEFLDSTPADRAFAHRHPGAAMGIGAAAEIIGIDASELADGLRAGMSVAEIAADNGMSRDDLVSQLVDAATERIETWVDATPGANN